MKKILLFPSILLSLLALSACALLPNAKPSETNSAASRTRTEASSSDDYDDYEDYEDEEDEAEDRDDSSSDDNQAVLQSLTDMDDIEHWQDFKDIVIADYDGKSSSKEEIHKMLGKPQNESDSYDMWEFKGCRISIFYNDDDTAFTKMITLTDIKKVGDFSNVKSGMKVQELIRKHGRPSTIGVISSITIFTWMGEGGDSYSVSFTGDTVSRVEKD